MEKQIMSEYKRFEGILALNGTVRVGMEKKGTSTHITTYLETDRMKNLTIITDLHPQYNSLILDALKRAHGEDINNKNLIMVFRKNEWKIGYSPNGLHNKVKDKLKYIEPPLEDAEFIRSVSLMILYENFSFLSYILNQAFGFGKVIEETDIYKDVDGYG